MSAVMLSALLLQAICVVLLRHRLGKSWLRRPVTIMVLASVVYQGVSPVLMSFPSIRAQDAYRQGVQQAYSDNAMLILSAAMLGFTVAYLLSLPERSEPGVADRHRLARVLDWRLLAMCCAPLAVLTYEGRGYNARGVILASASTGTVLASSFFVILVALAAFALILRKGTGWFLPVLACQSLLLAAAGERTPVIADAIVLIVLLCHAGMRPAARQLQAGAVLAAITVLAITGVRSEQGRSLYTQDSGFGARVAALQAGLGTASANGGPGLISQTAVRLDGTDFAAAVLQSVSYGQPRLSPAGVPESLLIVVPSAVWPSKLSSGAALNPALDEINRFGLRTTNFLPGFPGLYVGFLSPPWLIAFLALCGLAAGWAERWLLRSSSPARMVMLAAAVTAALSYEKGLPGMLASLRTGAILALAVLVLSTLRGRRRAHWMATTFNM